MRKVLSYIYIYIYIQRLTVKLLYLFDTYSLRIKGARVSGFAYIRGKVEIEESGSLTVGDGVSMRKGGKWQVRENASLEIGENTTFNTNCSIVCREKIHIGSNNAFGPNVLILDHDHDYKHCMKNYVTAPIEIGDRCWIGANVIILKGSKIGNGVIVGAGTVIKGTIPNNTVVYNKQHLVYKEYAMEEQRDC